MEVTRLLSSDDFGKEEGMLELQRRHYKRILKRKDMVLKRLQDRVKRPSVVSESKLTSKQRRIKMLMGYVPSAQKESKPKSGIMKLFRRLQ